MIVSGSVSAAKAVKPRRLPNTTTTSACWAARTVSSPARSTCSTTCGARNRRRRAMRARRCCERAISAAMRLKPSASASSSSPVAILIRCSSCPAPSRSVPSSRAGSARPGSARASRRGPRRARYRAAGGWRSARGPGGWGRRALAKGCSTNTSQSTPGTGAMATATFTSSMPVVATAASPTVPSATRRPSMAASVAAFAPCSARLMSGWAISWPGSSTKKAWPVHPARMREISSQMSMRLTSATTTPAARRLPRPPRL
jgi:hypothetical protein